MSDYIGTRLVEQAQRIAELEATIDRMVFERDRKDEQHKYVVQKLEAEKRAAEVEAGIQICLNTELEAQLAELG